MQVKSFIFSFFLLATIACDDEKPTNQESDAVSVNIPLDTTLNTSSSKFDTTVLHEMPEDSSANFTIKITEGASGFGYEIYNNNSLVIRQPHIPAVQGMHEFACREDAQKVAKLVAGKLKNGISPPSVSIEELTELGINL